MKHCCIVLVGLLVGGASMMQGPCVAAQATARAGATISEGLAVTSSTGVQSLQLDDTALTGEFTVSGASGAAYSVTTPDSATVNCGKHLMTVSNLVCSPAGKLSGGSRLWRVGATLVSQADQAPGQYTGSFEVTVDYE